MGSTFFKSIYLFLYNSAKCIVQFREFYLREKSTPLKKWFKTSLLIFKANNNDSNLSGVLLVQMTKDFEYTIKMAAASKALADKYNYTVKLHDPIIFWTKKDLLIKSVHSFFFKNTYEEINLSYGNTVGFRNSTKYHDQVFIKNKLNTIIQELDFEKPEEIINLYFEDILVGDLIYDTYLRFYHKPTIVDLNNDVIGTIEIALNIFYNFKKMLDSENVKALVNTYTSYIQHGITARICLKNGINVYTVAQIFQKIEPEFPYHQINHTRFNENKVLNIEEYEFAKNRFESRFSGIIDSATSYMRVSAFSNNELDLSLKETFLERPRNIVIYMHEFYDSPHINRLLQFPDLYQYLKQTLETLIVLKSSSVFIKLHPNAVIGCREEAIDLINSFKCDHFYILDESVSNLNIIELKPDLVCTARGTIGIEMAYFGIPVVALFDNIYCNFKFVHTCNDLKSYFSILLGEIEPHLDFDKDKIISFYFQAYLDNRLREESYIFDKLASYTFKYDTYQDDYLDKIFKLKDIIFSEKFISYYKN